MVRLLRDKSPSTAERILKRLEQDHRIAPVGDGYYLGLDPYGTPDQRMILAVWGAAAIYRPSGAPGPLPRHLSQPAVFPEREHRL